MSRDNPAFKHSRRGIASCVLGISVPVILTVWVSYSSFDPADASAADAGYALFQGLVMWVLMLTPLVLAISGLLQPRRRKLFAVIGLVLSLTPLILLLSLILA